MKIQIRNYLKKGPQRIDIKIDPYDTWNLDATLAKIIYPMLVQLRDNMHGVPNDFANVGGEDHSLQQAFDFYTETVDDSFKQGVEKWKDCIDKMIWSFNQIAYHDYDSLYHHGIPNYDWQPDNSSGKKMFKLVDRNPDEHWYDYVGHQLHEEKIQEGLNLFAKYYRNLWD